MENAFNVYCYFWIIFVLIVLQCNPTNAVTDCDCYEFGTEQTALGISIYDDTTCECKCKDYVEGKRCDRCRSGFYNIKTRFGCEPCLCDISGSKNQTCNAETGQCVCREGFSGYRCKKCQPLHFRKSQKQCVKCNCNIFGSKDLQCDEYGYCPCHDNVEGRLCDRCRPFTHLITKQCPECPKCYQKINETLTELQNDLAKMKEIVESDGIANYVVNNEEFVYKLKEIHMKVLHLKDLVNSMNLTDVTKLKELQEKGTDLSNEVKTILLNLPSADNLQAKLEMGEKNLLQFFDLIKTAEESLKHAESVNNDIPEHSSSMEELAKKAVELQTNIGVKSQNLQTSQKRINETCEATCKASDEYSKVTQDFHTKLDEVKNNLLKSEEVDRVNQWVDRVKNRTEDCVKQNVENVKDLDDLMFPNLTVTNNNELYELNKDKIENITKELHLYGQNVQEHSDIPDQVGDQLKNLEKESNKSLEALQKIDHQTDDSLQEIHNLFDKYANISDYNMTIQHNKDEMNLKLDEVAEIRDKISDLSAKIKSHNTSLEDSRNQLNQSTTNLNKTIVEIMELQMTIDGVQITIRETQANLSRLLDDIKNNRINSVDLETRLKDVVEWQEQVEKDRTYLQEAERNLTEIRANLKEEYETAAGVIQENIDNMAYIIEYLSLLPTTEEEFAAIEKELTTAEDILRLREEIEFLRQQVDHVKKIKDSLPLSEYCPKRIDLESKNVFPVI